MTKKLFSCLFFVMAVILAIVPVSAEASGGTVISTVVPPKYTIIFDIDGSGSVEYDGIAYKDGDTVQVREGTDMTFRLQADKDYKLKSLSYNGKNVKQQVSDNVLIIKNVQENGTLAVTFAKSGSAVAPATGDSSHIWLWTILAFGSIGMIAVTALKAKKSKHS